MVVSACVSRAPITPNWTPIPVGLYQRTIASIRVSPFNPGSRKNTLSAVPYGRGSEVSMYIPPRLKSWHSASTRGPSPIWNATDEVRFFLGY